MTQLTHSLSLSLWWGSISFARERVWTPSAIDLFNYLTKNLLKSSDTTNRSDFGIFLRSIIQSGPHRSRWPQIRRSSLSLSAASMHWPTVYLSSVCLPLSTDVCPCIYCLDISQMIEIDNSIFDRSFFFFLSLASYSLLRSVRTKVKRTFFLLSWFYWREERHGHRLQTYLD